MAKTGKPNSSSEQDISETSTLSGAQDAYEPVPVPASIRRAPTNYLHVLKKSHERTTDRPAAAIFTNNQAATIWGQYFIDLSIPPIPQTVPYVLSVPENLVLHAQNGAIAVDVWVTGNNKLRLVSMKLVSDDGNVDARVHDAFSGSESEQRPSLDLTVDAKYGDVSLSLPRCFRGTISINSDQERIVFSPAFEERTALLSDFKGIRVYFVGDRPRSWMLWNDDDNNKEGEETAACSGISPDGPLDKLFVSRCGLGVSVRIRWDGEPELPV